MKIEDYKQLYQKAKSHEEAHAIAMEMLTEGKQAKDENILFYAYFYLSYDSFYLKKLNEASKYIERFLNLKSNDKDNIESTKILNLRGIVFSNQGNELAAIENYMAGIKLAEKNGFEELTGMLYSNVGCAFYVLGDSKTALNYLAKSIRQYSKKKFFNQNMLLVNYINITPAHLELGNNRHAVNFYKRALEIYNIEKKDYDYLFVKCVEIKLILRGLLAINFDESFKEFIEKIQIGCLHLDVYNDILEILDLLIVKELYSSAKTLIKLLEEFVKDYGTVDFHFFLVERKIRYAKAMDNQNDLAKLSIEYFDYAMSVKQNQKKLMLHTIKNKFSLDNVSKQMESETSKLKEKAEKDNLTGLLNRNALTEIYYSSFYEALENQTNIGVSIIDIDYFKQYNDSLGHVKGDDCLKLVANEMKRLINDRVYFIRYGGDEFLGLYIDMSNDEILANARKLKANVEELCIRRSDNSGMDYVTVTQGIFNGIPHDGQKPLEFTKMADVALYKGKVERGGIYFIEDEKENN